MSVSVVASVFGIVYLDVHAFIGVRSDDSNGQFVVTPVSRAIGPVNEVPKADGFVFFVRQYNQAHIWIEVREFHFILDDILGIFWEYARSGPPNLCENPPHLCELCEKHSI